MEGTESKSSGCLTDCGHCLATYCVCLSVCLSAMHHQFQLLHREFAIHKLKCLTW